MKIPMLSQAQSFDEAHAITLTGSQAGVGNRVLHPGDIVGGSYRLKSLLGQGGMGYVFKAEHIAFNRDYALKIAAPEKLSPALCRRFEVEGRAISRLDHANIVKVYDMGVDQDTCPYYVMDLLDGSSLASLKEAKTSLTELLDLFIQIASGLGYAHDKGIIHRDVKPSNIVLITTASGRKQAKIVDFGIVKLLPAANMENQSQTATGDVIGSPFYMSPEQCNGSGVDRRSDIYSLGCSLFELLCGVPPFRGESAMATVMMHELAPVPSVLPYRPELPPSVDILIAKMMAKRPEDRYQSMSQVSHDMERLLHGKTIGHLPGNAAAADLSFHQGQAALEIDTKSDTNASLGNKRKLTGLAIVSAGLLVSIIAALIYFTRVSDKASDLDRVRTKTDLLSVSQTKEISAKDDVPMYGAVGNTIDFLSKIEYQQQGGLDPDMKKAAEAFRRAGPIRGRVVDVNGAKQLRINFPSWTLGILHSDLTRPCNAAGTVYVPLNARLQLDTGGQSSRQVIKNPEIFDKIGPDLFYSVEITGEGWSEQRTNALGIPSEKAVMDRFIADMSKWTKLAELEFQKMPISSQSLTLMDRFPRLKSLTLKKTSLRMADLVRMPFFLRLTYLRLETVDNIDAVCEKLAASDNIEKLVIHASDLTPESLGKLRGCKTLRYLEISDSGIEKLLPVVMQMPHLDELYLHEVMLTRQEIEALVACPNIRHLSLSRRFFRDIGLINHYKYSSSKVEFR